MKIWIAAAALLLSPTAFAADGKALFEGNGCVACHAPDRDTVGPSLARIAAEYKGKKAALVKFLEGSTKPVVAPDAFATMKPNLAKTQALTAKERQVLADYLLGATTP